MPDPWPQGYLCGLRADLSFLNQSCTPEAIFLRLVGAPEPDSELWDLICRLQAFRPDLCPQAHGFESEATDQASGLEISHKSGICRTHLASVMCIWLKGCQLVLKVTDLALGIQIWTQEHSSGFMDPHLAAGYLMWQHWQGSCPIIANPKSCRSGFIIMHVDWTLGLQILPQPEGHRCSHQDADLGCGSQI